MLNSDHIPTGSVHRRSSALLDFEFDNVRWHDLKGTADVRPVIDQRHFVIATVGAADEDRGSRRRHSCRRPSSRRARQSSGQGTPPSEADRCPSPRRCVTPSSVEFAGSLIARG